jgi:hypothetical protein
VDRPVVLVGEVGVAGGEELGDLREPFRALLLGQDEVLLGDRRAERLGRVEERRAPEGGATAGGARRDELEAVDAQPHAATAALVRAGSGGSTRLIRLAGFGGDHLARLHADGWLLSDDPNDPPPMQPASGMLKRPQRAGLPRGAHPRK